MSARENYIISVAGLVLNAKSLSEAALAGNFNEARILASAVATNASILALIDVVLVARDVCRSLGHFDGTPDASMGLDIMRLASQLDAINFIALS